MSVELISNEITYLHQVGFNTFLPPQVIYLIQSSWL